MIDWTREEAAEEYSVLVFIGMRSCAPFVWRWTGKDLRVKMDTLAMEGAADNEVRPRSKHLAIQGSDGLYKFIKDTSTTIANMAAQQSREDRSMTVFKYMKLGVKQEWGVAQIEVEEMMGYRV